MRPSLTRVKTEDPVNWPLGRLLPSTIRTASRLRSSVIFPFPEPVIMPPWLTVVPQGSPHFPGKFSQPIAGRKTL